LKIAILGAGIGGLSSAIALKQKGFEVAVYERHRTRSDMGAGIVCWPNASFVLQQLGLLDDIANVSGRPVKMQRLSHTGEDLGALDILKLNQQMGYPSLSILRRSLMRILDEHASRLAIQVKYHHTVNKLAATSSGLSQVHFDNGSHIQADLIIGADGRMNSIARQFVNGDNQPVYQGFINWVGVFNSEQTTFSEIAVSDYWGVGERFGIVPISSQQAYWAGAIAAPQKVSTQSPVANKKELVSIFQHWPDPIATIIENTPATAINKIDVHDHNPIDVWHKHNVLLIGDAAHAPLPTSGQGACQALEDAWQLAVLLDKNHTNLKTVFDQFMKIRHAKTTSITLGARQFAASLFNTNPGDCLQRNRNSQATDYHSVVNAMAKGWGNGLLNLLQNE